MRVRMVGTRSELHAALDALAEVADVDVVRAAGAPMDGAGRVRFRVRLEVRLLPSVTEAKSKAQLAEAASSAVASVTPIRRAVSR